MAKIGRDSRARIGEVLVAIMNNQLDFAIAREQHWYRIPVESARRLIGDHWPPRWVAFYQTKVFGPEAYAVNYFARVTAIRQVERWQLFPGEPRTDTDQKQCFQLILSPLERLPQPVFSRRWRRIVFDPRRLPSCWGRLRSTIFTARVPWRTVCGRS